MQHRAEVLNMWERGGGGGFRDDGWSTAKKHVCVCVCVNDESPVNAARCISRSWESGLEWRERFRGLEDFCLISGCTRREQGDVGGECWGHSDSFPLAGSRESWSSNRRGSNGIQLLPKFQTRPQAEPREP